MFQATLLSAILIFTGLVSASCSSPRELSLCCETLQPYSDNSYVWENECSFYTAVPSTLVASGCEVTSSWKSSTYEGMYAACCVEYMPGCEPTDGAVGWNCTGSVVD
ncbi:hypothetical protein WOLCODRAFT_61862 [Wolfiporia cocos MD-104 SS10]|uniref:Hydrophobin n=1 Tax=Wolfiporia cocos (strain MD-104) TaxID=742152 RepID=A0A2H3JB80_WOLCO|nr:hypothetical protein WOLCODRAFT_61862 [Wolfiporia cocos MD-104 SS10]